VIQGEQPNVGPGGVLLRVGELSVFEEDEVLLEAPMAFEVVASTKVENTVVVVMQVLAYFVHDQTIRFLSECLNSKSVKIELHVTEDITEWQ
jgi:hypothetical protein